MKSLYSKSVGTKDFKALTPDQVRVFYECLDKVASKYIDTQIPVGQQDSKIKLELQSVIGQHGIRLTKNSYNSQMIKALRKYREKLKENEKATPKVNDNTGQTYIGPMETLPPADVRNIVQRKATNMKQANDVSSNYPEIPYVMGEVGKKQANKSVYSRGEQVIADRLDALNIPYEHEATFEGLTSEYGTENDCLPCDFAINVNGRLGIIEYNGEQHYVATNVEAYSRLMLNDSRRLKFALTNGIPLMNVHYQDSSKTTLERLVDNFITDIKNEQNEHQQYTSKTYAYFEDYQASNTALLDSVFKIKTYPNINKDDDFGFVEIDTETIIIWDKTKLLTLITDNKQLNSKINAFYQQNKALRKDLERTARELQKVIESKQEEIIAAPKIVEAVQIEQTEIKPEQKLKTVTYKGLEIVLPNGINGFKGSTGVNVPEDVKVFIKNLSTYLKAKDIEELLSIAGIKLSAPTIRKYMK